MTQNIFDDSASDVEREEYFRGLIFEKGLVGIFFVGWACLFHSHSSKGFLFAHLRECDSV